MIEILSDTKKTYHYEPIERRNADRRSELSDRRVETRGDSDSSGRRKQEDRRKK